MFWRILLEVLFVLILVFAGVSFWSCLKAPPHLRSLLVDPVELQLLIDHFGYNKLLTDAQKIKALLGTFGNNITMWDIAHYKSLSLPRNLLLVVVFVILGASWWLGAWYFAVNLLVFLLLGFADVPAAAKDNNANHLITVMLNLIQWRHEDARACEEYCCQERPEYRNLYDLLVSLESRTATASD